MSKLRWMGAVCLYLAPALSPAQSAPQCYSGCNPPVAAVQMVKTMTASDGSWSVTWPTPFPSAPTVSIPTALISGSVIHCQPVAITTTGANGQCWQLTPTTLPATVTTLPNFVVSPFVNAAAGIPITVAGGQNG